MRATSPTGATRQQRVSVASQSSRSAAAVAEPVSSAWQLDEVAQPGRFGLVEE